MRFKSARAPVTSQSDFDKQFQDALALGKEREFHAQRAGVRKFLDDALKMQRLHTLKHLVYRAHSTIHLLEEARQHPTCAHLLLMSALAAIV